MIIVYALGSGGYVYFRGKKRFTEGRGYKEKQAAAGGRAGVGGRFRDAGCLVNRGGARLLLSPLPGSAETSSTGVMARTHARYVIHSNGPPVQPPIKGNPERAVHRNHEYCAQNILVCNCACLFEVKRH